MANIASVVDGKVATQNTTSTSNSSSSLDKDAFLQLLVTQMKYQDPLEPTENTEYVSQLATFSELEEMENFNSNSSITRATSLVGQYVTVNVTGATGETTLKGGKVDYVAIENGKAFLNIDGTNYSIDDLDSVVDEQYLTAYNMATDFLKTLSSLPTIGNTTLENKETIEALRTTYDDMTDYQKQFIDTQYVDTLKQYEARIAELSGESE